MIESLKKLVTYTLKDNFFISLLKTSESKEIIVSSSVITGSEISVHRPVCVRDNLSVYGNIFLGRIKKPLFDANNKILKENISVENSTNGELFGVYYNTCVNTVPKDSFFLNPLFPMIRIFDETQYLVEEFENKNSGKTWFFTLPSYVKNNSIRLKFYFLNTQTKSNVSFKFGLFLPEEEQRDCTSEINFIANKGIIVSDTYTTNIVAQKNNSIVNDKLVCLKLIRNKAHGSIDNLQDSIYLIGIKIEYDVNYFFN